MANHSERDAARMKWNEIRNAVEHMDERIRKGLVVDELIGLWIDDDGIELSGQKISFDELAEWMRELHGLSELLAAYHEQ